MKKILSALFNHRGAVGMAKVSKEALLKDPRVVEEIKRHLWIESEKAGHSIGFDKAADDWITKFSAGWVKHYMSDKSNKSSAFKKNSK
ncbi:MAG: hypothetical protein H6754_05965 [Candidatus Omnitrophica bacterium]|nr:hypothetical protein [Candidatus Omnitrophota bacterium]